MVLDLMALKSLTVLELYLALLLLEAYRLWDQAVMMLRSIMKIYTLLHQRDYGYF